MGDEKDVRRLLRIARGRHPDTGRPLPTAPHTLWRRRIGDPVAAGPRALAPLPAQVPVLVRPADTRRPSQAAIVLAMLRAVTRPHPGAHPLRLVRGDG